MTDHQLPKSDIFSNKKREYCTPTLFLFGNAKHKTMSVTDGGANMDMSWDQCEAEGKVPNCFASS